MSNLTVVIRMAMMMRILCLKNFISLGDTEGVTVTLGTVSTNQTKKPFTQLPSGNIQFVNYG
jgi:hypothetical protein